MKERLTAGERFLYELAKAGYKSTEIALQLGTTDNAVRQRLSRMNKKIGHLFKDYEERRA